MAVKTTRTVKKPVSASPVKAQSLLPKSNGFNLPIILKNKKLTGGIGIAVIVIVVLLVLFKSIFIAAIVNGEPVSRLSVITALEKQGGKATLESIVTKKLILQEAKKRNVSATQNDIDVEIKKITTNLQAQGTTLDQALAAQNMTKADLNDEIKIQVVIGKMVGSDVSLTTKEIDDFVTANKSQMAPETTEAQFRTLATQQLKQQKLQTKTQEFVKNLQDKAKIIHFVSY